MFNLETELGNLTCKIISYKRSQVKDTKHSLIWLGNYSCTLAKNRNIFQTEIEKCISGLSAYLVWHSLLIREIHKAMSFLKTKCPKNHDTCNAEECHTGEVEGQLSCMTKNIKGVYENKILMKIKLYFLKGDKEFKFWNISRPHT